MFFVKIGNRILPYLVPGTPQVTRLNTVFEFLIVSARMVVTFVQNDYVFGLYFLQDDGYGRTEEGFPIPNTKVKKDCSVFKVLQHILEAELLKEMKLTFIGGLNL